jgi:hypothetical protein
MADAIDNGDASQAWAIPLLASLGPGAGAERVRLATSVLGRCQHVLLPLARSRMEELLEGSAAGGPGHAGRRADGDDSDDEPGHGDGLADGSAAVPVTLARLAAACPGTLPALAPALQALLGSTALPARLAGVRALGACFSGDQHSGCRPGEHRHVWSLLIGRFSDASPRVRVAVAAWAARFAAALVPHAHAGSAAAVGQVMEALGQRLKDSDDTVRAAAAAAVTAVAQVPGATGHDAVLAALSACVASSLCDIKPAVRSAASTGLTAAYAAYVARLEARGGGCDDRQRGAFDPIPAAVLNAAVLEDNREGGSAAVDALLDGRLFGPAPGTVAPSTVAACLVRAHAGAQTPRHGATLLKVISLRSRARTHAARWLAARQAGRSGGGESQQLGLSGGGGDSGAPDRDSPSDAAAQDALRHLAQLWPKPHAVAGDLGKLHAARDGHIFRAIQGLLQGDCLCWGTPPNAPVSAAALRGDATRRVRAALGTTGTKGGGAQVAAVLDALCAKLSPQPVDAGVLAHLLVLLRAEAGCAGDDAEEEDGEGMVLSQQGASCLALLQAAAEGMPAVFAGATPHLLALLRCRCPAAVTGALRLASAASKGLAHGQTPQALSRAWRAPLTALCTAGDAKQAKLAARCLVALAPSSLGSTTDALLAALPRLSAEALPAGLVSAAALLAARCCVDEETEERGVGPLQAFVCTTLAHRHSTTHLLPTAVKALVAAALTPAAGTNADSVRAAKTLVDDLLVPLLSGDTGLLSLAACDAPAALAVRCAAAKGLTKLALRYRLEALVPAAFGAMCTAVQSSAESPALRAAVRAPIMKAAARSLPIHARCLALLALTAGGAGAGDRCDAAPGSGGKATTTAGAAVPASVLSAVWAIRTKLHLQAQTQAPAHGDAAPGVPGAALTQGPEQALFYCLWGLAHCPHLPASPHDWATSDPRAWLHHVQRPLEALLLPLLSAPPEAHAARLGQAKAKAGASLPQLMRQVCQVKLSQARECEAPGAVHAAADVAEAVLYRAAAANKWDAAALFPVQTPMPKLYFQVGAAHGDALQALNPNAAQHQGASGRSLLPPGFKLLPDAPADGDGAAKKRGRPADDDASDGEEEERPGRAADTDAAPKARPPRKGLAAAKAGAKAPPAKKARGPAAAPRRAQPKRGATKATLLADSDDDDTRDENNTEDTAPAPRAKGKAAATPRAKAVRAPADDAMQVDAPPAKVPKHFTLMVSLSKDSDEETETTADRALNPVRRANAPPAAAPEQEAMVPLPEAQDGDEAETGVRMTGRNARRRR